MNEFWTACLGRFEKELPAQQYNTWIRPLRLEGNGAGLDSTADAPAELQLIAPNLFIMKWVRERYLGQIQALSRDYFQTPVSISLGVVDVDPSSGASSLPATNAAGTGNETNSGSGPLATLLTPPAINLAPPGVASTLDNTRSENSAYEKSRLNPNFTFDNLVTGRANDLARAAAQQVAQNPGNSYNPLFIYGGVGLGKTHLVHALGNEVWKRNPSMVIRYVHAEDYFADVVRAYQQKSFDVFKRYYRSLDLLLIDDIQFFNNKNRTQEEFFYAFNALVEAKKQIVITCDTYPKDIAGLEERLVSRFDWGLTVQIEPPEPEMRVAILKKKAEAAKINLGDDVAFLIAKNLRSNVRELEGALNRVLAYVNFNGKEVNMDVAKEALKDIFGATNRQLTLDLIQKTVADYYKLKVTEMHSKKRSRAIARPRQVAMWLARELTHHSLPEIGEAFGGRDHTTVLHAYRTINDLRSKEARLGNDVHVLMQTLKG
ncbi:chromosomal replication initiator protein DnaA [Sterolibacterium denitrificans]|nr:chromosomal replication initiator protein DnaA [Sterolibacterium denitrificans]